jgi:hypothetical protein
MERKVDPYSLKIIYDLLQSKNPPSFRELCLRFCPNPHEYKGYLLVRMFYVFERGGVFASNEIISTSQFRLLSWEKPIDLGEANGPHSSVLLPLKELVVDILEDPFEIYLFTRCFREVITCHGYLEQAFQKTISLPHPLGVTSSTPLPPSDPEPPPPPSSSCSPPVEKQTRKPAGNPYHEEKRPTSTTFISIRDQISPSSSPITSLSGSSPPSSPGRHQKKYIRKRKMRRGTGMISSRNRGRSSDRSSDSGESSIGIVHDHNNSRTRKIFIGDEKSAEESSESESSDLNM